MSALSTYFVAILARIVLKSLKSRLTLTVHLELTLPVTRTYQALEPNGGRFCLVCLEALRLETALSVANQSSASSRRDFSGENHEKVNVLEFVSLDGVIQAPGGPEEDTSGGFEYGGWIIPFRRCFFGIRKRWYAV